ncbi:MAG: uncharacterized protein PWQ82_199 [Thermosediminibacterales bacterium]|nr:uncharacterized protein [Thermosediminibacterales bacterium]MDK2835364.1 uncharacterized protein [Thermosediminibacterales bacterium]
MKITGKGKMLKIFIGENDKYRGKPLFDAIVQRLQKEGLAGATVIKGIEGYGANSRIHTSKILRLSEDLPIVIEVIDKEDRIEKIIPILDEMVKEGLVLVVHDVEIIKYT